MGDVGATPPSITFHIISGEGFNSSPPPNFSPSCAIGSMETLESSLNSEFIIPFKYIWLWPATG